MDIVTVFVVENMMDDHILNWTLELQGVLSRDSGEKVSLLF